MSLNKSTIDEVVSLLKGGSYEYQIKKILAENEIEEEEQKMLFKIAKNIIKYERRKVRRIKVGVSAFIIFVIFTFLIPLDVYTMSSTIISFVGSIIVSALIFQTIMNFDSWDDFQNSSKLAGWKIIVFIITVLFIGTVLGTSFEWRQNSRLANDGIITNATVTKYVKFETLRKSKMELVYIKYKTFTGSTVTRSFQVLEKYRPGEIILIEYSQSNPYIVKILREENTD